MVSKTIELRKVVTSLLKEVHDEVFYENASNKAIYPYVVFNLDTVNFGNTGRDDFILTIDVWDRNKDSTEVEILSDKIEEALGFKNNPTSKVLPTFYKENKKKLTDEDKSIRRRQLTFTIQSYYTGG